MFMLTMFLFEAAEISLKTHAVKIDMDDIEVMTAAPDLQAAISKADIKGGVMLE